MFSVTAMLAFGIPVESPQAPVVMLASGVAVASVTSNASRRVVGQWGGAGGAFCEDHLALRGRSGRFKWRFCADSLKQNGFYSASRSLWDRYRLIHALTDVLGRSNVT